MKGKVVQFRQGKKTVHHRHFLIDLGAKDIKEALKFVGKQIQWISPSGKVISGKVSGTHGAKGLVRAIFEIGLPGQSINTEVEVK